MALTVGFINITQTTARSVSLAATPALGGTPPYSYQWYRSNNPNFVPSAATLLSGQTLSSINDTTVLPNSVYYYILTVTDSSPLTLPYPVLGVLTNGPSSAGFVYPQVVDFQGYFFRDFPYGVDINTSVTNPDILKALQMCNSAFFNPDFFGTQADFTNGFLMLSAHYLCMNLMTSSQGIQGQYSWLQSSKSVGVSESFSIPQRILDNPDFAWLSKTNYGATYLNMIMPQLTGQMFAIHAMTNP